jgi:glycosyltransferase involved in cell wall biosynthesis
LGKYKICVYAISKNEEQFVDRWMDSVGEADLVVVADTGSTDATVEKLRARGALVTEVNITPWRFDHARNAAMDLIPEDVDICVSNDLDEVFEPGWRTKLEAAWQPQNTRARYWFVWSHKPDGSIDKQFSMEKIHRRHDFRWVHPVHEVLEYSGEEPDNSVYLDLTLHHYPDDTKPRSQYLPLLELSAAENPEDDRTMFWLGREYVYKGRWDEGIATLERHLALPSAMWDEERCASMRFIARAYREKGDTKAARSWLFRAVAECPHVREPYLELARLGYGESDWPLSFFAVEKGLAIRERGSSYLVDPAAWWYSLYDLGAIACYRLALYEKARQYGKIACELSPQDERLRRNLELIEQKCGEVAAHE